MIRKLIEAMGVCRKVLCVISMFKISRSNIVQKLKLISLRGMEHLNLLYYLLNISEKHRRTFTYRYMNKQAGHPYIIILF